jgi:hypothetical protein
MMARAMRVMTIVIVGTSVLAGAALVRGVSYALTHAVGFSLGGVTTF